jgi:hypothetical protein
VADGRTYGINLDASCEERVMAVNPVSGLGSRLQCDTDWLLC